jgi:hypothetical protein
VISVTLLRRRCLPWLEEMPAAGYNGSIIMKLIGVRHAARSL